MTFTDVKVQIHIIKCTDAHMKHMIYMIYFMYHILHKKYSVQSWHVKILVTVSVLKNLILFSLILLLNILYSSA